MGRPKKTDGQADDQTDSPDTPDSAETKASQEGVVQKLEEVDKSLYESAEELVERIAEVTQGENDPANSNSKKTSELYAFGNHEISKVIFSVGSNDNSRNTVTGIQVPGGCIVTTWLYLSKTAFSLSSVYVPGVRLVPTENGGHSLEPIVPN
jgi:hypothetical protein